MLLTLHTENDHHRDVQAPADQQDAGRPLADAGFTVEAIALLGIGHIHGVGFQTLTKLGGRQGISNLLCAKDVFAFGQSLSQAGSKRSVGSLPNTWTALRRTIWANGP